MWWCFVLFFAWEQSSQISHSLVLHIAPKGIREMSVSQEGLGCNSRGGKETTFGITGAYQVLLNANQLPWGRGCAWIGCLPVQSRSRHECSTEKNISHGQVPSEPWSAASCLLQVGKVVRPPTGAELLSLFHISSSFLLSTFAILNSNSSLKLIKEV